MRKASEGGDTGETGRRGGVQTIERAFHLLEVLAAAGGEMSISQLAEESGLPMPTIHRLLRTLVAEGYVRQQPSRRYALGPRLIWLGESAERLLAAWALPHLEKLVAELDETANVAMLDGDRAVYVAQVPGTRPMRTFTEVGRRVHLHSTGVGKALLAALPDEQMIDLVNRIPLPANTERTIVDRELLLADLREGRERGFTLDDGEQDIGVRCVAVTIPAEVHAAISVSAPSVRLTDDIRARAARLLRRAADELGRELISRNGPP
ncbi:MAG TPA: IclR family transcriptional regulator [Jiangellaceae bacterium]|nr:IclR family transcriptional regulator [Jiangellaceae bacterium]